MQLRTPQGVFRPICDFRGNVLALLDESGDIAESYRYDGFGRMRVFDGPSAEITASAVGNPFGFACKRYDPTTALCHFGARWYDPALGRFLSPDPLGFVDGPNRYAYCAGDPVNFVDPWGLCGEKGYYRVEAPVVGPFGNYYPNRPTWYSRPLADVCNALANLLNLGLLPTEPWRRFDRYAYETWDWYERSTDWLESDQALFLWVALGGTPAAALNAWEHAGYVAANASVAVRAGGAGLAGRVAPGNAAEEMTTVSRWGREGLRPGDFVMEGGATRGNYYRSGKWQPGMGNQRAAFEAGQEFTVPKSALKPPSEAATARFFDRGVFGWVKKLLGQRAYKP